MTSRGAIQLDRPTSLTRIAMREAHWPFLQLEKILNEDGFFTAFYLTSILDIETTREYGEYMYSGFYGNRR